MIHMEGKKNNFNRGVRKATEQYMEILHVDYRRALDFFRELRGLDVKILDDAIIGLSGIKEVRHNIGEELYELFLSVSQEKELELLSSTDRLDELRDMRPGAEKDAQILDFTLWWIKATGEKVKTDARIKVAFAGKEEELTMLIESNQKWLIAQLKSVEMRGREGKRVLH